jgi:DivIVA domain-containing protein
MALTPEDVVNKRFQPTKFREGYDQDEVDDFLDEVVVELRRLNQENEELRSRLVAGGADVQGAAEPAADTAPAAEAERSEELVPAVTPAAVTRPVAGGDVDEETSSTASLLQLARRLHDEHVREGLEKRDSLIAEGRAEAARVLAEAEETQRSRMGALQEERKGLEDRIDDLRVFETEYRQKLKSYIEGQLRELDADAAVSADAEHAGIAGN